MNVIINPTIGTMVWCGHSFPAEPYMPPMRNAEGNLDPSRILTVSGELFDIHRTALNRDLRGTGGSATAYATLHSQRLLQREGIPAADYALASAYFMALAPFAINIWFHAHPKSEEWLFEEMAACWRRPEGRFLARFEEEFNQPVFDAMLLNLLNGLPKPLTDSSHLDHGALRQSIALWAASLQEDAASLYGLWEGGIWIRGEDPFSPSRYEYRFGENSSVRLESVRTALSNLVPLAEERYRRHVAAASEQLVTQGHRWVEAFELPYEAFEEVKLGHREAVRAAEYYYHGWAARSRNFGDLRAGQRTAAVASLKQNMAEAYSLYRIVLLNRRSFHKMPTPHEFSLKSPPPKHPSWEDLRVWEQHRADEKRFRDLLEATAPAKWPDRNVPHFDAEFARTHDGLRTIVGRYEKTLESAQQALEEDLRLSRVRTAWPEYLRLDRFYEGTDLQGVELQIPSLGNFNDALWNLTQSRAQLKTFENIYIRNDAVLLPQGPQDRERHEFAMGLVRMGFEFQDLYHRFGAIMERAARGEVNLYNEYSPLQKIIREARGRLKSLADSFRGRSDRVQVADRFVAIIERQNSILELTGLHPEFGIPLIARLHRPSDLSIAAQLIWNQITRSGDFDWLPRRDEWIFTQP